MEFQEGKISKYLNMKTTSLRFCADFEGSLESSSPRASIFARNSTSS